MEDICSDYWVCACVKRSASGEMTGLKMNHPFVVTCLKCKCTKKQHDEIKAINESVVK